MRREEAWRALSRLCAGEAVLPPRTLVVVAHPDDEAIGAGGLLSRLGAAASVLFVTDGAPADRRFVSALFSGTLPEYARERRRESEAALALAGIGPARISRLGVRDQEAAHAAAEVARELAGRLAAGGFAAVVAPAYEGGHPDHDAVALAARAAADLLEESGLPSPLLAEMPLYHAAAGGGLATGAFLAGPSPAPPARLALSPAERSLKAAMIAAHRTQAPTLRAFLPPRDESFRPAPRHDFGRPPHPGPLLYEAWGFPLGGGGWRSLARAALVELAAETRLARTGRCP